MFKNMISPVQAWLLSQKRCVGCGTPLSQGKQNGQLITCACKRAYIYNKETKTYRRALLTEL